MVKALFQTKQLKRPASSSVIDCGALSDIGWSGQVSTSALIDAGRTSPKIINYAVAHLDEFYVPVNPRAKTRCIDGRPDPESQEAMLGAQMPGGTSGAALAYRLGVDKDDFIRGTFLSDAEAMIGNYLYLGFMPGGHRDEIHRHSQSAVGCGAIDSMDKILMTMTDPRLAEDHKRVVELLLGPQFDRDNYLNVIDAAKLINGRSKEYFKDRELILDALEKRAPDSVATLRGQHQECLVVINLVADTTLASNRLAATYDGIQAFGYDLWCSQQLAEKLLPRPDQAQDRKWFVMASVIFAVATLMTLTDGTQRLVLRVLG